MPCLCQETFCVCQRLCVYILLDRGRLYPTTSCLSTDVMSPALPRVSTESRGPSTLARMSIHAKLVANLGLFSPATKDG